MCFVFDSGLTLYPGTKVIFDNIQIRDGVLLMRPGSIHWIGGKIESFKKKFIEKVTSLKSDYFVFNKNIGKDETPPPKFEEVEKYGRRKKSQKKKIENYDKTRQMIAGNETKDDEYQQKRNQKYIQKSEKRNQNQVQRNDYYHDNGQQYDGNHGEYQEYYEDNNHHQQSYHRAEKYRQSKENVNINYERRSMNEQQYEITDHLDLSQTKNDSQDVRSGIKSNQSKNDRNYYQNKNRNWNRNQNNDNYQQWDYNQQTEYIPNSQQMEGRYSGVSQYQSREPTNYYAYESGKHVQPNMQMQSMQNPQNWEYSRNATENVYNQNLNNVNRNAMNNSSFSTQESVGMNTFQLNLAQMYREMLPFRGFMKVEIANVEFCVHNGLTLLQLNIKDGSGSCLAITSSSMMDNIIAQFGRFTGPTDVMLITFMQYWGLKRIQIDVELKDAQKTAICHQIKF